MRVLALVPYPLGLAPGQRYRIEQWAPRLASEGVHLTFDAFLSRTGMECLYRPGHVGMKTWAVMQGWAPSDPRSQGARPLPRGLRLSRGRAARDLLAGASDRGRRRRWSMTFDDAIYLPRASPPTPLGAPPASPRVRRPDLRLATRVTVGNGDLAAILARRPRGR